MSKKIQRVTLANGAVATMAKRQENNIITCDLHECRNISLSRKRGTVFHMYLTYAGIGAPYSYSLSPYSKGEMLPFQSIF